MQCRDPKEKCLNTDRICIISASYGENCGVEKGSYTNILKSACFGKYKCDYKIDHN